MNQTLNAAFAAHTLRYVGIGLVSGSIVHAGTLGGSILRYEILIILGIIFFAIAMYLEQHDRSTKTLVRYIAISVVISIGTGMASGGFQHFIDGPRYAAGLIPLGLALSYIAFAFRDFKGSLTANRAVVAIGICGALFLGLHQIASILPENPHHHDEEAGHHDD
jgi:hypothetical protein